MVRVETLRRKVLGPTNGKISPVAGEVPVGDYRKPVREKNHISATATAIAEWCPRSMLR